MAPLPLPKTQRAVLFHPATSTLSLSTTYPVPDPLPSTLLLRVHSTAICTGELTWAPFLSWPKNQVPCYDVSGTVVAIGDFESDSSTPSGIKGEEEEEEERFHIGDKVHARIPANRPGATAQFTLVHTREAAHVPPDLSMRDAATLPLSAHTAWQALFEHGLLTGSFTPTSVPHIDSHGTLVGGQAARKRVLILGAAGAVGGLAVQFAALAGAVVVGTAGPRSGEYVKGLGVREVLDYTTTTVAAYVAGGGAKFDVVFDTVGGAAMLDAWTGVKEGGTYVSVVPGFKEPEGGKPERVRSKFFIMETRGEELRGIGALVERGRGGPPGVGWVWGLEEFEKAFERAGKGTGGKVVFRVAEEEGV